MDPQTLFIYAIGAAQSLLLAVVLVIFAHLQAGVTASRRVAFGLLCMAVAFLVSAYGPLLPIWVLVIGTNMLFLVSAMFFLDGIALHCAPSKPSQHRWIWGMVVLTSVPFAYWGLVEPNGTYRSMTISLALAIIFGRTLMLLRAPCCRGGGLAARGLTVVAMLSFVSMVARLMLLAISDPTSAEMPGANPTHWVTVLWYIVLITLFAAILLGFDADQLKRRAFEPTARRAIGAPDSTRANIQLVWSLLGVLILALCSLVGVAFVTRLKGFQTDVLDGASPAWQALIGIQPLAWLALLVLMVMVAMGFLLTATMRRRDEYKLFLAMLSHELKTPLSTIALTLVNPAIPVPARTRIERNIEGMRAVLDRCLQLDRLESGQLAMQASAIAPEALIRSLLDLMPEGPRFSTQIEPGLVVDSDPQWVTAILENLLENAAKYGDPEHPIQIRVRSVPRRGRNGVSIEVANWPGQAGFPEPAAVFSKFYRAPGAHKNTGSGLGLYIASHLARALQGRLRYHPTPNQVVFDLWLPKHAH